MITFKQKFPLSKDEFSRLLFLEVTRKEKNIPHRNLIKIGKGVLSMWGREKGINIYQENKPWWKEGVDYVWGRIQSFPRRWFTDALGVGSFGVVLPQGPGKVEKIGYSPFHPQEIKFYKYLLRNPLPVFPKIYSLGKDRVVMERIETGTQEIKVLREYISRYIEKDTTDLLPVYKPRWKEIIRDLGEDHWFVNFLRDIEDGLQKIYEYKTIGDLSPLNVGQRKKTGEFVYFDPVAGDILKRKL